VPFKANQDRRHHIPKQRHRVTNWARFHRRLRVTDGIVYAALDLGHFGAKLWRRNRTGNWRELPVPAFPPKPEDAGDDPHPWSIGKIWALEPGRVPGRVWAGTMPGGLSAPMTAANPGR
jgi:hypothetical protein